MPTRQEKEQMVAELKEKMEKAQVVILADYHGITVDKITELRSQLRKAGCELKVAKNTLTKIAAKELGIEGLDSYLVGPTVLTFGYQDPAAAAKILSKFAKEIKEGLDIKVGVLEGAVVDKGQIKELANLPSREELLAKVVGGMQAPLYGFAGVLAANLRNLVYVLEAVRKNKEEQAAS
ncbi:large subunit ribosomal protein L10 [Desulfohalotomaculum tongense]|uniref:50S ribosomal protein L10 n=1 Tax=Desulforadius tongensis TaxID=1216062 RepID=UPI00195DBE01|nr:50S ribosomal protein L10 [Desulforadius tongensis]MBM7853816.1 large subunit ribosomal protein L10 [Desulforadius tongensis]